MTMPPPAGPPPYQPEPAAYGNAYPSGPAYGPPAGVPGYGAPPPPGPGLTAPAPPPARRPGNRRAVVAGLVALVLLLVGGTTAWWLTRDEDRSPLAGQPRVTDEKAGISYAIPEGWERSKGGLIDAFTSAAGKKSGDGKGGSVMAGRAGGVPQPRLRYEAERAASSNAEFFCPDGKSTPQESKATTVGDRPAHTALLKVTHPDCGTLYLRMTLISLDDSRSAFLLGLTEQQGREQVDRVLEDASLL